MKAIVHLSRSDVQLAITQYLAGQNYQVEGTPVVTNDGTAMATVIQASGSRDISSLANQISAVERQGQWEGR